MEDLPLLVAAAVVVFEVLTFVVVDEDEAVVDSRKGKD